MRWGAENDFDGLLVPQAQARGLEIALVKAIIGHESGFDPRAYHFDGPDPALNASFGLMQVEGATARAYGFTGDLSALYDPATNLDYGTHDLADALNRFAGDIPRAVSAYNGGDRPDLGFGTPFANGVFGNQAYVDTVLVNLRYFRGLAGTSSTPAGSPTPAPAPGASSSAIGKSVAIAVGVILGVLLLARLL